eukprot:COSAG02_NODE_344_length_24146_cov_12.795983_13_plen_106_part_00
MLGGMGELIGQVDEAVDSALLPVVRTLREGATAAYTQALVSGVYPSLLVSAILSGTFSSFPRPAPPLPYTCCMRVSADSTLTHFVLHHCRRCRRSLRRPVRWRMG